MSKNRSANTYQKIDTVFKRDINNVIMPYDELVYPELEFLRNCKFDATEKIDGTNIRIEVTLDLNLENSRDPQFKVEYKGKSDNAQIPPKLLNYLKETFPKEKVLEALSIQEIVTKEEMEKHGWNSIEDIPTLYTIYGEGYGEGIQSGGRYIKGNVGFIVFDVKVNDIYLLRNNMISIAEKLGAKYVPYMGQFTIDEAIDFVRKGFKSIVAEDSTLDAEGLVLTTPLGIKTRRGDRIIFKIKTVDFQKYRQKYGTDDKVEQLINQNYSK